MFETIIAGLIMLGFVMLCIVLYIVWNKDKKSDCKFHVTDKDGNVVFTDTVNRRHIKIQGYNLPYGTYTITEGTDGLEIKQANDELEPLVIADRKGVLLDSIEKAGGKVVMMDLTKPIETTPIPIPLVPPFDEYTNIPGHEEAMEFMSACDSIGCSSTPDYKTSYVDLGYGRLLLLQSASPDQQKLINDLLFRIIADGDEEKLRYFYDKLYAIYDIDKTVFDKQVMLKTEDAVTENED